MIFTMNEDGRLDDRLRISIKLHYIERMQKEIYTLVADFSITRNLAYLSHQETMTMFQRGFVRASVPLVYSGGFNPHPRLSVPFPRTVGTGSQGDRFYATVEYSEKPSLETLTEAVNQIMPEGCCVKFLQCLPGKAALFPESAEYQFHLQTNMTESLATHIEACRNKLQEGGPIEIRRYWAKKRSYKVFDIAPFVQAIHCSQDLVEVKCSVSQSGTVRVDELMDWLHIAKEYLREPVCRTGICWFQN